MLNNENIIKIRDVKKSYGQNSVFSGLNLNIRRGEILSVIGPNGCGKTTLFKMILKITKPDKGEIEFDSRFVPGFLIEELIPFERLNLLDNLKALSILTRTYGKNNSYNDIISASFCEKIKSKPFRQLSSGQKRKAMFALSLINDPETIILDEPFNSLDLKERIDIISSIRYLKETRQKTVIISSHDLTSLYQICDQFCFIKGGVVIDKIPKEQISSQELNSIFLKLYC